MKRLLLALPAVILLAGCGGQTSRSGQQIEEAFLNPPEEAAPWNYWYWINENISKEGITRDLEAMAGAGIKAALIGNVTDGSIPIGEIPVLSDQWWDAMAHAVREGKRVGVDIGMFNCPGWSQSGGPWINSDETMRYVRQSEMEVAGPKKLEYRYPAYKAPSQPVFIQAFRKPATDNDVVRNDNAAITARGINGPSSFFDNNDTTIGEITADSAVIHITAGRERLARSMQIFPESNMGGRYRLEYKDAAGEWKTLLDLPTERYNRELSTGFIQNPPTAEAFEPVTARDFRITFTGMKGGRISGIALGAPARVSKYIEKQLGKMAPHPYIKGDTYEYPESVEPGDPASVIKADEVINLTGNLSADGLLTWDVPKGEWIVLRSEMAPTGITNSPSMPQASGYEVDKMNREYTERHFDAHVGKLLEMLTPEERTAFKYVIADSYEKGAQNWTDGFAEDFETRYGYDPYPWLPVLTGRVIDNADRSERFLWDVRRLVADRIASEYVGGLRDKSEQNGMELWLEPYGHWGFPGEFLNYGGASHRVGGEFWVSDYNLGPVEVRCASSVGHTYGKNIVSVEAFTSGWTYNKMPRDLKMRGDWCFTQGQNHLVLHLYIHQPYVKGPGISAWFGTDFNRMTTWYDHAGEYFTFLRRQSAMLQLGNTVADVAYYIGENVPKMSGEIDPPLPAGYDYDFINAEVLMMESTQVRDGRITLGSGASYAVLVLPGHDAMRPGVLAKIGRMVSDGAVILGPAPVKSPSGQDYPGCDDTVRQLVGQIWGATGGSAGEARYGEGRVFTGMDLEEAFRRISLPQDITLPGGFLYTHRHLDGSDIYFVSNQEEKAQKADIGFRVTGMQPELWDPVSGEMRLLPEFSVRDGRTFVPLEFGPADSWFIVFRSKTGKKEGKGVNFPAKESVAAIDGPWNVSFDTAMDAPADIRFAELTDWSENSDPAIKYYSGEAVYTTEFDFAGGKPGPYYIDLGRVEAMAVVRLNGEEIGTLWRYPYSLDVTGKIKEGSNKLEITVINHWWNRLVGDKQPEAEKQYTWSTGQNWNKDSELLPAGLLGPVTIQTAAKIN